MNSYSPMSFFRAIALAAIAIHIVGIARSRFAQESDSVEQWGTYEVSLQGASDGNPYQDVSFGAEFTNEARTVTVPGFYDGRGIFKIRFSPDQQGTWEYVTTSNRAELNRKSGTFVCTEPTGNNHGPVRVVNTYYLEYADRSPFYAVGTTAYQWTSFVW